MNDRELLEMAAKAARLDIVDRSPAVSLYVRTDGCHGGARWNPLSDDGDALRLMIKLRMLVDVPSESGSYREHIEIIAPHLPRDIKEPISKDMEASTRRAIVRAAADIGKAMP